MLKFIAAFRIDFITLFKALQKILAYNMTANIDNPIHQKKKKKKISKDSLSLQNSL